MKLLHLTIDLQSKAHNASKSQVRVPETVTPTSLANIVSQKLYHPRGIAEMSTTTRLKGYRNGAPYHLKV